MIHFDIKQENLFKVYLHLQFALLACFAWHKLWTTFPVHNRPVTSVARMSLEIEFFSHIQNKIIQLKYSLIALLCFGDHYVWYWAYA